MNIGEGKNPDEVVKTRRIPVTSENINEVAKDIQMDPSELSEIYMSYKRADRPLFVVVMED